jgi:hypothetical protein
MVHWWMSAVVDGQEDEKGAALSGMPAAATGGRRGMHLCCTSGKLWFYVW